MLPAGEGMDNRPLCKHLPSTAAVANDQRILQGPWSLGRGLVGERVDGEVAGRAGRELSASLTANGTERSI